MKKRYYAEYGHPNTGTTWNVQTNDIRVINKIAKKLETGQYYCVWDSELNRTLFLKYAGDERARIDELS